MTEKKLLEGTLNVSTLFLFLLFIGCTFCSILCIDENRTTEAITLGTCGFVFLLLTLWSDKNPFYPLTIGFLFYLTASSSLIYFFPKVIIEGVGITSPYIYLMLGFLVFVYLIPLEYIKNKSVDKTDKKENSQKPNFSTAKEKADAV